MTDKFIEGVCKAIEAERHLYRTAKILDRGSQYLATGEAKIESDGIHAVFWPIPLKALNSEAVQACILFISDREKYTLDQFERCKTGSYHYHCLVKRIL